MYSQNNIIPYSFPRSAYSTRRATTPLPRTQACSLSNCASTLPLTLTSARPPTPAWEVARTVVAQPSSVVKCLWEVFVWGFGVLFLSCACVCRCRGCCSLSVCVCDLLIFLHKLPLLSNASMLPSLPPPVGSRIGPDEGFGSFPGKLLTLK